MATPAPLTDKIINVEVTVPADNSNSANPKHDIGNMSAKITNPDLIKEIVVTPPTTTGGSSKYRKSKKGGKSRRRRTQRRR